MEIFKNFRDAERKFFSNLRKVVRCLPDLSGSQYLFQILQTSLTVKNSENAVKSGCFEKSLRRRVPISFRIEGGI